VGRRQVLGKIGGSSRPVLHGEAGELACLLVALDTVAKGKTK